MSARKPTALLNKHDSNETKAQRAADEAAMIPGEPLPVDPPARLKGKTARATWKKIVTLYDSAQSVIATAFDAETLFQFCELVEEVEYWKTIRADVDSKRIAIEKSIGKTPRNGDDAGWKKFIKLQEQDIALLARLASCDQRVDSKRAKLLNLAQAMYLTPRSRAGVAPQIKEQAPEMSAMEKLIEGLDL